MWTYVGDVSRVTTLTRLFAFNDIHLCSSTIGSERRRTDAVFLQLCFIKSKSILSKCLLLDIHWKQHQVNASSFKHYWKTRYNIILSTKIFIYSYDAEHALFLCRVEVKVPDHLIIQKNNRRCGRRVQKNMCLSPTDPYSGILTTGNTHTHTDFKRQ